jgi:hypothetical protein
MNRYKGKRVVRYRIEKDHALIHYFQVIRHCIEIALELFVDKPFHFIRAPDLNNKTLQSSLGTLSRDNKVPTHHYRT